MANKYPVWLRTAPVTFWSENDELAFLDWAGRIACVARCDRDPFWERIAIARRPTEGELRDLIGLFIRYGINLKPLAQFVGARNQAYFRVPSRDWYEGMFGG